MLIRIKSYVLTTKLTVTIPYILKEYTNAVESKQ